MLFRFPMSLTGRMAAYFAVLVTAALVFSGLLAFTYARNSLRVEARDTLVTARDIKKEQIRAYLSERMKTLRLVARSREVAEILAYAQQVATGESVSEDALNRRYGILAQNAHKHLGSNEVTHGLEDLVILAPDRSGILYTVRRGLDGVSSKAWTEDEAEVFAPVWSRVRESGQAVFSDFAHYEPAGRACLFAGVPIVGVDGSVQGVLVGLLDPDLLNNLMQEATGLGTTGETYLVGSDGLLRSQPRLAAESLVLRGSVATDAVRSAMTGKTGDAIGVGYRGHEVLSAYAPVELPRYLGTDFDWVVIAEKDTEEAFALIRSLAYRYAGLGLVFAGLAAVIGFLVSRSLVSPLRALSGALNEMSEGHLSVTISDTDRRDEVGHLVRGFRQMAESLRSQTFQVLDGVNRLATAISDISATSAQLAASSSETATSISQIGTTVEEVRRIAELSHQKADGVSRRAERMAETSREGRKVTEDTVEGLQRIREQMALVAENVMRLSEQGQSIGEIIEVVRDLADQVNLLSVNAAIEAAKAGEQGKGFAVVAQEMRSLADQSKQATEQVKHSLTEIQKATGGAVMAIERGTKAVSSGLDLGNQAGAVIQRLAQSMAEAAESAMQIAASSQEQLVGMEQLVLAMENIREASSQNTDGARHLEGAVRDLERLSGALKELSARFNL